ncbi:MULTISPECIES: hypothetical protein [unclassified Microcoleus]|uniref:hypothetical protein n=1 Tax=unclassified Microcoleus TaxID=2642155 RepID=UPI002FD634C4
MELTKISNQEQVADMWEGELSDDDLQAVVGGIGGGAVSNLLLGLTPILPLLGVLAPAVDQLGDDLEPVLTGLVPVVKSLL